MPKKKTEEKPVAAVTAVEPADKASSVTEKPKRKYTRKAVTKADTPAAETKAVDADAVKESPAPTVKANTRKKAAPADADKPKRKYTRKAAVVDIKPVTEAAPVVADEKPKRKPTAPKAEKKTESKGVSAVASTLVLQFGGVDYNIENIKERVASDSKGKVKGRIKSLDIYVKPEEHAVYYVINGKDSFRIEL